MPFLDWLNKSAATQQAERVPYHILTQQDAYGEVTPKNSDNQIIQGDNLLALKALLGDVRIFV